MPWAKVRTYGQSVVLGLGFRGDRDVTVGLQLG